MKMKDLCATERPREKLVSLGCGALSNGELLAILLRSGIPGTSVKDLSEQLLVMGGGRLTGLFSLSLERMQSLPGIGLCKAAELQAAIELGRRFFAEQSDMVRTPVVGPRMIYDRMLPLLKGLDHEECWVLLLNNSNYVIAKRRLSYGGSDSTSIDVRHIVRMALDRNASALILVHNHPSGNPMPSQADMKYTGLLHEAAGSLNIALLDHVIVCDSAFYSFADDRMYD